MSFYETRGDRLEVKGYRDLYQDGKTGEDVLMCQECEWTGTRASVLDATGDDQRCPECSSELWDFDDREGRRHQGIARRRALKCFLEIVRAGNAELNSL
jgi:hypothetical protein